MFWSVPLYGLEEVGTQERSQDQLAQDVGKQHSAFPSFWRKFCMKEVVLCHTDISEPGTNKSFLFCIKEPR